MKRRPDSSSKRDRRRRRLKELFAQPIFNVHEDRMIGRRIGPYRVIRELDQGGMGSVYLAERDDFKKKVAIKFIRDGLQVDEIFVRRFHNERQILARLEHPYIARLHDGGTTKHQEPYFVMEYVEGEPIDRYVFSRNLDLDERLELFQKVCAAVHYAHRHLVIHRDLKPGNILITADGTPKLLDFGIAKLLDHESNPGMMTTLQENALMTLRYASPEQVRDESVSTATDVYSLGVMLYQLLAGVDPYGETKNRVDLIRAICEIDPKRPSTAARRRDESSPWKRLSGDLDSILLTALQKHPDDRYASVERLSDDLRRHLDGQPVSARTGSLAYTTGKLIRRHWLATGTFAVFLVLILGFAATTAILLRQTEKEKREAEAAREEASLAFDFLMRFTENTDRNLGFGMRRAAEELREKAILEIQMQEDPRKQIPFARNIGLIFHRLGAYEEANALFKKSYDISREFYGEHIETARSLSNISTSLSGLEQYLLAEDFSQKALEMRIRLGQKGSTLYKTKNNHATSILQQGRFDEAIEIYQEVLDGRIRLIDKLEEDKVLTGLRNLAVSYRSVAMAHLNRGDLEKAEQFAMESLKIYRSDPEPDPVKTASVLDSLGEILTARTIAEDRTDDRAAFSYLEKAKRIYQKHRGDYYGPLAGVYTNMALFYFDEPEKAEELLELALLIRSEDQVKGWRIAEINNAKGALYLHQGRFEEAEPLLIESYETLCKIRGERTYLTVRALARIEELSTALNKPLETDQCRVLEGLAAETN